MPSPLALLSWHGRASDFVGRREELSELDRWAHSDIPVSIKFLAGAGGIGKSRLAATFATRLMQTKWSAGFVDLRRPARFPLSRAGTLLVIDYPEQYPKEVRELLRDLAALGDPPRMRVLFLSRRPMDQWIEVVNDTGAEVLLDGAPVNLGPLCWEDSHRLYLSVLSRASEKRHTTPFGVVPDAFRDWFQSLPEHRRALFVVALAVYGAMNPDDPEVTFSGAAVIDALAQREISRLHTCAERSAFTDRNALARLLAVSAISGGISVHQLPRLAEAGVLGGKCHAGPSLQERLRDLGILYETHIRAPTPDIVAAALATRALAKDAANAPELVWLGIELGLERSVEAFCRISYDAELVLGIREHRVSSWLAISVDGNTERAKALRPIVSETRLPLGLIPAAASVWRTLLSSEVDESERAPLLNNLSADLAAAGDRPGALEASREAVEIYRRLAEANPARYEPDLASSLNNLSNHLAEAGDRPGALETIRERLRRLLHLALIAAKRLWPPGSAL